MNEITVIELWPYESECIACGQVAIGCKQGIPMFEGEPVPHAWTGEWAGFDACVRCFTAYERVQADPAAMTAWWEQMRRLVRAKQCHRNGERMEETHA